MDWIKKISENEPNNNIFYVRFGYRIFWQIERKSCVFVFAIGSSVCSLSLDIQAPSFYFIIVGVLLNVMVHPAHIHTYIQVNIHAEEREREILVTLFAVYMFIVEYVYLFGYVCVYTRGGS